MKKKQRRSSVKCMTKEARILKHMREIRGLSMRKAAKIIGTSEATVNHLENGRKNITDIWIYKFISAYGFSFDIFNSYLDGKIILPNELVEESIRLLKKIPHNKVRVIYELLRSFSMEGS